MFKFKQRYLILIALILLFSVPSYSQESTAEPALPTEAATAEIIVTEAPTEVASEAPTAEIIVTEAPTEVPIITEEAVVTEVPTEAPIVTEVPTEANPIPTEAPANDLATAPRGETVEMLLQYNPNASADSIAEMLRTLGAVELERIPQIGAMRVLIPSSVSNLSAAQSALAGNNLASIAGLMSIEPNVMGQIAIFPNDPEFPSNQPNLKDFGANSIYMQSAWALSPRDGQGVTVAVLDTGLDLQHPEFASKFVAGWDFVNDDNNPDDDQGHGTHVAGVIAARTNNGVGIASIAFNSMLLPVKVCDALGGCPLYETAAGIVYAVDRGARVINMSLSFNAHSTTLQAAVNYAIARNVVVVAAVGNDNLTDNSINYPASYAGVISVGAVDTDGNTIANFSNTNAGNNLTISAPGVNILSTWPLDLGDLSGYDTISGTSMASPHVAGLAALLIADGIATTPASVREALICSALERGAFGYDTAFGYGFIQADSALTWNANSSDCQVSLPNDLIQNAMTISNPPFSVVQAVSTRSVTESASDPKIASITANQTLWYKFTPSVSAQYMFSTLGSGAYDTLLGVYRGQAAELVELASNNDYGVNSGFAQLSVSLSKGITYYVQVGTNGGDVSAQYVQLNVNPALTATTVQQENVSFIRYTGSWNRLAVTGASGGYVNQTSDPNATMSFLARGSNLNLNRLVGPTQGTMEIFIDGSSQGILDNNGALNRFQNITIALGLTTGQWHIVMIRMGGGNAPMSIDSIQVTDDSLPIARVGATRVNDSATAFSYNDGTWSSSTGNPLPVQSGDLRYTSTQNAYIEFRTTGTAITIWRATGAGTGEMQIWVDGEPFVTVDNALLTTAQSVPYSIGNLPQRERVVRVVNSGTGDLVFDGAQSLVQTVMMPGTVYDERHNAFAYSGFWARSTVATSVANAGTLSVGQVNDVVEFSFIGNHFCLGHQQGAASGRIFLSVDSMALYQIDYDPPTLNKEELCSYNMGINDLSDSLHTVRLFVNIDTFSFDYFRPVRRTVFTLSSGYVAESNAGFFYDGTWMTSTQKSLGGYTFQGGSARRADVSTGGGQEVSWTMNGSGFILYTALDIDTVAGAFEIYVDGNGTPMNIIYQGTTVPYLDTWDQLVYPGFRFRPIALGVIDLGTGIHTITLEAIEPFPAQFVYFDGIRILP